MKSIGVASTAPRLHGSTVHYNPKANIVRETDLSAWIIRRKWYYFPLEPCKRRWSNIITLSTNAVMAQESIGMHM